MQRHVCPFDTAAADFCLEDLDRLPPADSSVRLRASLMPPLKPSFDPVRARKWIWTAFAICTLLGCIRFRNDAPADAGPDTGGSGGAPDGENDAGTPVEGGDAVVVPPPICDRFNPSVADNIAGDLITEVAVNDCALRRHFANLPPASIVHLQECLTAQIGQVMGCRHPNGEPFKYPTLDSKNQLCRDMKSSHMMLS